MSLADLDKGGTNQFNKTWLGPTLGWVMLPVIPQTQVTAGSTYVVVPYNSQVLLRAP
jgi:hypothetical protein